MPKWCTVPLAVLVIVALVAGQSGSAVCGPIYTIGPGADFTAIPELTSLSLLALGGLALLRRRRACGRR